MIGFVCFCCAASSVYLLNDLFDLSADRQHPHKSKRAIASGLLSIKHAVYLIATFLFAAILLASKMPVAFVVTLAVYYLMTLLYFTLLKANTADGYHRVVCAVHVASGCWNDSFTIESLFFMVAIIFYVYFF